MAEFYGGRGEALADLERTHKRTQEMNDGMGGALKAHALGRIYSAQGDAAKAESYVDQALAYYRRNRMAPYLKCTLETLAKVSTQQARTFEAEKAHAEARRWQQSLAPATEEVARGSYRG